MALDAHYVLQTLGANMQEARTITVVVNKTKVQQTCLICLMKCVLLQLRETAWNQSLRAQSNSVAKQHHIVQRVAKVVFSGLTNKIHECFSATRKRTQAL
jgi:hypothetical protein